MRLRQNPILKFPCIDIMPLRQGHTLVIPKAHYSRVSELPPEIAAAVGQAVSRVARALSLSHVCQDFWV